MPTLRAQVRRISHCLGRNKSLPCAAPVPEPASVWSMMAGLVCLGGLIGRRRRQRGADQVSPAPGRCSAPSPHLSAK
ncbi:MAG: PEP-CTERM sorting domain-containing protein [Rhodoferax sp.]|nr:PEP-CTERM sorting domain-containing protein [Rhodoferax sp.]MCP5262168.1 PEP-CTERM sorting domain-containing protein [Rhodoferax sp.]